jgi:hypothetical protein
MSLTVERESLNTKSRHVSLTATNETGEQVLVGSEYLLPTYDRIDLRLREGRVFALGVVLDFANPLGANSSIDIGIAWPAGVTPEISFFGLCQGDAIGFLYEGSSLSGGTPITPVALNRDLNIASEAVAISAPTVNSLGTMVLKQILIGGTGKKAGGGETGSSNLILKPLTTYLVRLTNANGTAHAAEMVLEWTE